MALDNALAILGEGSGPDWAALNAAEAAKQPARDQLAASMKNAERTIGGDPAAHPEVTEDQWRSLVHGDQGESPLSNALSALEETAPAKPAPKTAGATGQWEKAPGGLPDTTVGRAAAGALGVAKGAWDMLVEGPAQLLGHTAADVYPSNWPGAEFFQSQRDIAEAGRKARQAGFEQATAQVPTSAKAGELAGNVIGAIALPQGKAAEGANLFNRAIAAAKTGGIIGLATPTEEKDFWTNKALQSGLSAAAGFIGQPIAETAGKLIGGAVEGALGVGRRIANWATGQSTDAAVANVMQKASPELQQAVQSLRAKGQNIDLAALGRQVEADSLPVKMSLTPGQALQNPAVLSNEWNLRSQNQAITLKFQDQEKQLVANLHAIRDIVAPDAQATHVIASGQNIAKAADDMLTKQRDMTSKLYQKLTDANGGELPIDGKAFADSATEALKKQMKAPFLPSEVKSIVEGFKSGDQPMTFENFENLRTILAAAGRKAQRAGDGNAVAALHLVRDSLENTPISSEVAGVKQLADVARSSAKYGFDLVRDNPALKAIDAGKEDGATFIQKYVIGGSPSDITGLAKAFQHDPLALQDIKGGVINYLDAASGATEGKFSQANYNKIIQKMGPKLDIIFSPEEAAQIRTLGTVARYTSLAPRGNWINTSNTDVANLARTGGNMAARAIDRFTGLPLGSIANEAATAALEKKAGAKTLGSIVNVGAGVARPSNSAQFLLRDFPQAAGAAGALPLSVLAGQSVAQKRRENAGKGQ